MAVRELHFLGFEGVIFSWLWGNYVSMALKELPFRGWSCEGVTFPGLWTREFRLAVKELPYLGQWRCFCLHEREGLNFPWLWIRDCLFIPVTFPCPLNLPEFRHTCGAQCRRKNLKNVHVRNIAMYQVTNSLSLLFNSVPDKGRWC